MKEQMNPGRKWMNVCVQKGSLGQWLVAVVHIRRVLGWTVGKFMGGEVDTGLGVGSERLLEIQSHFSRMEGNVSRGKDKQTS